MGLTPASDGRWAFATREPIRVVAAISAFNHPLNLIVHQAAPANAVGCPVIVKPAAATPLCCLELVALLREAGSRSRGARPSFTEDNALSERLATDPRVAFLSFIGSARVGWYLRSKLAPGTALRSNTGEQRRSSSTAAPSSTGSSSLSSRAAIIAPARFLHRRSASSSIAISRPNSSSFWRRGCTRSAWGTRFWPRPRSAPSCSPARRAARAGASRRLWRAARNR